MNRMPLTMTHYRKKGFAITNSQLRNEVFLKHSALQLTTVKLSCQDRTKFQSHNFKALTEIFNPSENMK